MAEKLKTLKIRYKGLHRYLTGITVIGLIVGTIASAMAGARVTTITYRLFEIWASLWLIEFIVIRTWASWENVRRSEVQPKRR